MKYLNKKTSNLLIFGCWLVYVAAYVGRKDYSSGAATLALGLPETSAGLIYSFFAVTYGIGQLVNGILCRFYNPKYVMSASLLASVLANVMMSLFAGNVTLMAVAWFINGAAQSILWSLIIRTLSRFVTDKDIGKAIYVMSTPVAAGTATAYGLSALFSALGIWDKVFYVAAAVMTAAAVAWYFIMTRVENAMKNGETVTVEEPVAAKEEESKKVGLRGITMTFGILLGIVAITAIANGFIKDGVNEWMPAILKDQFGMNESTSIILSLSLPLFSVLGACFSKKLHDLLRDHMLVDAIFYGVSFIMCLVVLLTLKVNSFVLTLALFICVACMMSAVNNVITSMIPLNYRKQMDSGFLAGALDTVCYVGGALAGVWLGAVKESSGWTSVFTLLMIFSVVSAVLSLGCCLFFRAKHERT